MPSAPMAIHKLIGGGIETVCDHPGCRESYSQVTLGPAPEGRTQVDPPGSVDPLYFCCDHSQPAT
jgi:hypothetical protein